jgi:hypothetical protein
MALVRRRRVLVVVAFVLTSLIAFVGVLKAIDVPPRTLAPYIERRLSDHDPLLNRAGAWLARELLELDRGAARASSPLALRIGAQAEPSLLASNAATRLVMVASPEDALDAIGRARPGDVITLEPGTYRFSGSSVFVTRPGSEEAPIVLRSSYPRKVLIEMDNLEGFVVSAPYWRFENLTIRGVCADHSDCDHAFHVVGNASHFVARNNTLIDFNAHVKVNGQGRRFPDDGIFEGNTVTNTAPRRTDHPVTPFDLVAASHWIVRANMITDFIKAGGDGVSYGAFVKGGGSGNRMERNVVLCEDRLRGLPGLRVGLSLGGGGSANGRDFCRESTCAIEQQGGRIESNLIAFCSDDGIYVNRGANSTILANTLIDTGGIVARFVESGALVEGNLVDGAIRSRDGAALHAADNLSTGVVPLYFGRHPHRQLFRDAPDLDLSWTGVPPRREPSARSSQDLCGGTRPSRPAYGAFEEFSTCKP